MPVSSLYLPRTKAIRFDLWCPDSNNKHILGLSSSEAQSAEKNVTGLPGELNIGSFYHLSNRV